MFLYKYRPKTKQWERLTVFAIAKSLQGYQYESELEVTRRDLEGIRWSMHVDGFFLQLQKWCRAPRIFFTDEKK